MLIDDPNTFACRLLIHVRSSNERLINGRWLTDDGQSVVSIEAYEKDDKRICGYLVQYESTGDKKVDGGEHTVNPIVGETNDSRVNNMWADPVQRKHVFDALANAAGGSVEEGSVGAGTGTQAFGWKGGIG